MSILILPSRLSLKPERSWDVPRPEGRRGRSAWWRRLLGGRAGATYPQPGSCCGPCGGGGSEPCDLSGYCTATTLPSTLMVTDAVQGGPFAATFITDPTNYFVNQWLATGVSVFTGNPIWWNFQCPPFAQAFCKDAFNGASIWAGPPFFGAKVSAFGGPALPPDSCPPSFSTHTNDSPSTPVLQTEWGVGPATPVMITWSQ